MNYLSLRLTPPTNAWRMPTWPTLIVAASLCGCGNSPPATLTGAITIDQKPMPTGPNISGIVMFYPVAGGAAAMGSISAGAYEVKTGSTAGLAPGEYRVTVRVVEMGPPPDNGNPPPQQLLSPPAWGDQKMTRLKFEVQPGANVFNIDLPASP